MKRKQVWRYYCEFCKRSGGSGGHIARHEKSCTANPDRVCGFCVRAEEMQAPMAALIAALTSCGRDWEAGVKVVRKVANACPACMLAAIRQSGVQKQMVKVGDLGEENEHIPFDFNAEVASFWSDHNHEQYAGEGDHGY